MLAETGEWPGVKHQDSQCFEFRIFKFATAPVATTPCRIAVGCGVVNEGLTVEAIRAANGSTLHLCTIQEATSGMLKI